MSKELTKQFDIIKKSIPKRSSQRKGCQGKCDYEQIKNIMLSTYLKEKFSEILEYSSYTIRIGVKKYREYYDDYGGKFVGSYDKNGWPRSGEKWGDICWVNFKDNRAMFYECIFDEDSEIANKEKYYKNFINSYKNSKKRFHFFNINVALPVNKKAWLRRPSTHTISAIYDSETKSVDFFDTNEKTYSFESKFDVFFKSIFDDIYGKKNYTMNYSKEYFCLKDVYFECVENGKYDDKLKNFYITDQCSVFTLWFLELRLSNPGLSRKQISDFIINKATKNINEYQEKEEYLCDIVRRYGLFVYNYTKDYIIENKDNKLVVKRKGKILKSGKYLKIFLGFLSSVAIYNFLKKKI